MEQNYSPVVTYSYFYETNVIPPINLEKLDKIDNKIVLGILIGIKNTIINQNIAHREIPFIGYYISFLPRPQQTKITFILNIENGVFQLTSPVVINKIISDVINYRGKDNAERNQLTRKTAFEIFDLILLYNEKQYGNLGLGLLPDSIELIWRLMLMQDINGANSTTYVRTGAIKQVIFFEFLKTKLKESFTEFEANLRETLYLEESTDYIKMFLDFKLNSDKAAKTKHPVIVLSSNDIRCKTLEALNLVIDISVLSKKYLPSDIYSCPFIKFQDQNIWFMGTHDYSLITDKTFQYFLFKSGIIQKYLPQLKDSNNFWSFIGYDYFEKFLMHTIFQSIIHDDNRYIPSDDQKLPDATLLINQKNLFIIEIKSHSLNHNVWGEQDFDGFKTHLNEKYITEKKGVLQIINSLQNIVSAGNLDLFSSAKEVTVYPIIVYSEPHLNIAGVNRYIIENAPPFPESLTSLFQKVFPVTLIHCDFFLENFGILKDNNSVLPNIISNYWEEIELLQLTHQKSNTTNNYFNSINSFDNTVIGKYGVYRQGKEKIFNDLVKIFRK